MLYPAAGGLQGGDMWGTAVGGAVTCSKGAGCLQWELQAL